jgi:hypothetical protein
VLADALHLDLATRLAVSGELRRMLVGKTGETVLSCAYV